MFERIPAAPPDPIYSLTTECNRDPNPNKLNLGVGVYKNYEGLIPVLESVKAAERTIWEDETSKNYLPIDGSAAFGYQVRELLLGQHPLVNAPASITVQTPGGTGALRLASELIARNMPDARMWITDPSWSNHVQICQKASLGVHTYPYYDAARQALAVQDLFREVRQMTSSDVLMLHGCCHNPTGLDLDLEHWQSLAQIADQGQFLILVDFAYQGFGRGLEEDATGVRYLAQAGLPLLICSSFSKNFGLYNERIGALTVLNFSESVAERVLSQLKVYARSLWSSPPAHGALMVETVLGSPELRAQWEQELAVMRDRINETRDLLAETMQELGAETDFSFLSRQYGLFSLTGIAPEVVQIMRDRYSIYFMSNGRINVAGLTPDTIPYFCRSYLEASS